MSFPLGALTSLSDGNLTVNGSSTTYFSVLREDDEITINEQTIAVNTAISDSKFTVKTAITSATSGDMVYAESKCVWLRYQIWKIDIYIANYDLDFLGAEVAQEGSSKLQFNYQNTPLTELLKLKNRYEQDLAKCEAEEAGTSVWLLRREETGTL